MQSIVPEITEGHDGDDGPGTDTWRCVVTHTPSTMITKDDTLMEKIGIHVYFPEIYVDAAHHLKLRSVLLNAYTQLSKTHIGVTPSDEGYKIVKTWGDIIDKGVCSCPKLRLFCSCKATACLHTPQEKKTNKCNGQYHKHRINAMRRYELIDILDWSTPVGYTRNEFLFNRYTGLNEPFVDDATEKVIVKHRRELLHLISLRSTRDVVSPMDIPEHLVGENEDMANEALDALTIDSEQEMNVRVLVHMLGIVDNISDVDQIHALGKRQRVQMYKVYLHSKRCFNNCGDHTNNRIYVTIRSGLWITQMCFSESETIGRMGVSCKNFRLPFYKEDEVLNRLLFGKAERPMLTEGDGSVSHRLVANGMLQFIEESYNKCVQDFTQFAPVEIAN